jgi:hypothetical protein
MNASITAPATVQISRNRLLGLVAGVAALAAGITWVLAAVEFDNGSSTARPAEPARISYATPPRAFSLMKLTPARLAAGALGTGYQLPTTQSGPTLESVLASMSPQTRRWTAAVTSLTFDQLAAGAAGHP